MRADVLVIEDEVALSDLLRMYLEKEGIDTTVCATAEEAEALLERRPFDLIVLDINLPGKDGFEFLHSFRRASATPVMILSAREADEDIILGLGLGADSFINKPFAPRVLVARIRAMLRRARQVEEGAETSVVRFLDYTLDIDAYSMKRRGERVTLSSKEFEVLSFFAQHPGRVFSNEEIYEAVWGNRYGDLTAIGVYIQRLRKKIEPDPKNPLVIETVSRKGYRFNKDLLRRA